MGCNSICLNHGKGCLGCRGPIKNANFAKLKELHKEIISGSELEDLLTFYGDYEKIIAKNTDEI
jgi:hypothetical protein